MGLGRNVEAFNEAYQRELWNPEEGLIDEIQDTYLELEGFLEESMGNNAGDFQEVPLT